MAYFRTIVKGSMGAVETWSCSINWGVVGLAPDVADQATVDGMLSKLQTWTVAANVPGSLRTLLSVQGSIDGWRVEKRAEDESTLSVAEGLAPAPVPGTSAHVKSPQDALVFSLRTSTPGARGRGRLYWPALGAVLSNSFQLQTPAPATAAADARTWLNAIGSQLNQYFIDQASILRVALSVRSQTDHVNRNVNSLQIGSVLDTQRRRRDSLPESYVSVPYP